MYKLLSFTITGVMKYFSLHRYLQESNKYDVSGKIDELFYSKGEYIYNPPFSPPLMYEIVYGAVKIGGYSDKGDEVLYDLLGPGEVFGNLQYLPMENFQEFSRAVSDVHIRTFDLAFYKELIVHDPIVSEWFNKYIISRWCRVEARFFSVSSRNIEERVLLMYQQYSRSVLLSNGTYVPLIELFSQKDLADLTAATRQSVSQAMKRLKAKGKLSLKSESNKVIA